MPARRWPHPRRRRPNCKTPVGGKPCLRAMRRAGGASLSLLLGEGERLLITALGRNFFFLAVLRPRAVGCCAGKGGKVERRRGYLHERGCCGRMHTGRASRRHRADIWEPGPGDRPSVAFSNSNSSSTDLWLAATQVGEERCWRGDDMLGLACLSRTGADRLMASASVAIR